MEKQYDWQRVCRMCGYVEQPHEHPPKDWLNAIPRDGTTGEVLRHQVQHWCSVECRDSDPQWEPHGTGADLFQTFSRMAGEDMLDKLAKALAQSRGITLEAAREVLLQGGTKAVQKHDRPQRRRSPPPQDRMRLDD